MASEKTPRTLSEIGLTAKESSTFKQIDSPDPGHHRQDAGEIAKQDTGGNVFKYATPEDIKPRTLSEIGLTAKESSTFKQIDSPDPGHHRQDAGDIVEAIKAETERQRREKISEAAEIRERSESGTFTRSNNLLLQPIDPNTNAAATNY